MGGATYDSLSNKRDYRLSLMRGVQRLFNDSSRISVVGVAEIIVLGFAERERNRERAREQTMTRKMSILGVGRATLKLKW